MRILIADDSLVSRHLLEATLRKWNYKVTTARDGREAWNILRGDDPPRIAILDWVMPGLSGLEVCKNVRAHAKKDDLNYTYLVLLSSKSQRDDLIEGMEAGADDYLIKPFDQHELKVRLRAGSRIIDLERQLHEQATKDFLTGIWNRSAILDILGREIVRATRDRRPIGVVLADIDHFKSINDTFGHLAGDAVLREFARRVSGAMRPYDSLGRYGGEEFLAILPGCDEDCTASQAERMRRALSEEPMPIDGSSRPVTASFGACCYRPESSITAEQLIRAADQALYSAKRQGRNRTLVTPYNLLEIPSMLA